MNNELNHIIITIKNLNLNLNNNNNIQDDLNYLLIILNDYLNK